MSRAVSRTISSHPSGSRKSALSNSTSVARPAANATRFREASLNIVSLGYLGQFHRIAEYAVDCSLDGVHIFEQAERRIHLGPARAEELGKLGLGKAELQRNSLAGCRPSIPKCYQKKARQTHFDGIESDCLQ